MVRIIVVPERLNAAGGQFQQTASQLQALQARLGQTLGGLDWEARQRANVDGVVRDARNRATALANQAETLARFLNAKANGFAEADRQGSITTLPVPVPTPVPHPCPRPPDLPWPFPRIPWPQMPSRAEIEKLLKTLAALKPVIKEIILDKLGVGMLKDIWELINTGKYMEQMDRAHEAWERAKAQYGSDSTQALKAMDAYADTYENMPILGPYIKALLDAGRANPVY